jgi:hypothetical protein
VLPSVTLLVGVAWCQVSVVTALAGMAGIDPIVIPHPVGLDFKSGPPHTAEYALQAEEEFAVSDRHRTISYTLLRSRSSCLRCSTGATSHLDVSIYTRS